MPDVHAGLLQSAGGGRAGLLQRVWSAGLELGAKFGLSLVPIELGVTVAWTVVFVVLARRWFR